MLGSMGGGGGAQATAALGVMGMGGDKGCMPNLTYRQVPNKEHRPSAGNCHRPPAHTSLWHKPPSGPCQRRIALRGCVRSSVNHTPPISLSYRNLLPPVNASFSLSPYYMYPSARCCSLALSYSVFTGLEDALFSGSSSASWYVELPTCAADRQRCLVDSGGGGGEVVCARRARVWVARVRRLCV